MRCGRCGNDNAEGNRFCGMCGAVLAAKAQAPGAGAGQAPSVAPGNIAAPRPTVPMQSVPMKSAPVAPVAVQPTAKPAPPASRVEPAGMAGGSAERRPGPISSFHVNPDVHRSDVSRDIRPEDEADREPIISGPSFLGLNRPSARPGGFRADGHGGRDHLSSSGNVDYLLDDEEEPGRGWGKLLLVLVALALAGGFGYLHWRQGGFDWLKVGEKKPAATQPADSGQSDNGGATGAGATPDSAAPASGGAATSPATGTAAAPAASGTGAAPADGAAQANPAQTSSSSDTPLAPATASSSSSPAASASSSSPATPAQDNSASSNTAAPPTTGAKAGDSAPAGGGTASDSDAEAGDEEEPAAPKAAASTAATTRAAQPRAAATKPAAKPSAARPVDSVAEAERYIYGRGVRQDCDHGLRMLKSAAGQSDGKAMISLGALYSTGTCTPRDLPTAYRWFALALHKQPENQALQDDLQKLWSQMTQPERQLAIKLSQ